MSPYPILQTVVDLNWRIGKESSGNRHPMLDLTLTNDKRGRKGKWEGRGGEYFSEIHVLPCESLTKSICGLICSLSRVSSEELSFSQIDLWSGENPAINQIHCFYKREKDVGNENVGQTFQRGSEFQMWLVPWGLTDGSSNECEVLIRNQFRNGGYRNFGSGLSHGVQDMDVKHRLVPWSLIPIIIFNWSSISHILAMVFVVKFSFCSTSASC